mmetsp:Transcript_29569/g.61691  ORF Transcript_29569/g.61691 Transcript_29569/m.61691 type:complete len:425 (-) Transcript_29569:94-1368(-)
MRSFIAKQMGAARAQNKNKRLWEKRLGALTSDDLTQNNNFQHSRTASAEVNGFSFINGRGPYHGNHCRSSHSDSAAPTKAVFTPPPSSLLLLEGDEIYILNDGKSHTIYGLNQSLPKNNELLLEETFDIERARKSITLIGSPSLSIEESDDDLTTDLFSFDLQEINGGVKNGGSTGCMTWESSIVMSLYFALNPDELRGDVIELGSGVGLGGIMSTVAKRFSYGNDLLPYEDDIHVTLTDVNEDVLNMLRRNIDTAAKSFDGAIFEEEKVQIQKLDWFDFLFDESNGSDEISYDTVIASDCAYLNSQIVPLSEAIAKLLRDDGSKMHMFAPYNRAVIYDLVQQLREVKEMDVRVDDIKLSKCRVKQSERDATDVALWRKWGRERKNSCTSTSKFVHIVASHRDRSSNDCESCNHHGSTKMTDID